MGYDADRTRSTGVFFLSTSGSSPYCGMYIINQLVLFVKIDPRYMNIQ